MTITLMDVVFQYRVPPAEHQVSALGWAVKYTGCEKSPSDEVERTVKVEYDISRLAEDDTAALLRGAGLFIVSVEVLKKKHRSAMAVMRHRA